MPQCKQGSHAQASYTVITQVHAWTKKGELFFANVRTIPCVYLKSIHVGKHFFVLRATCRNVEAVNYFFLPEPHVQLWRWNWSLSCSVAENPSEYVQFSTGKWCTCFQENAPLTFVLFLRFPYLSHRFPCISGSRMLAEKAGNLQKRQGSCHTWPHSTWGHKACSGAKSDGPYIASCVEGRPGTNAHSLRKGDVHRISQTCACMFCFSNAMYGGSRHIPPPPPKKKKNNKTKNNNERKKAKHPNTPHSARVCRRGAPRHCRTCPQKAECHLRVPCSQSDC